MKFICQILLFIPTLCFLAQETKAATLVDNKIAVETEIQPKITELVSGFVLYRLKNGEIEYLLIKKKGEEDWTPPKGRLEADEDQMVAAVRETLEETTIYPTKYVIWDFRQTFEYTTNGGDLKIVDLWPANLQTPDHPIIIDPSEQDAYEWLRYPAAHSIIKSQYRNAFVIMDEYVRLLESAKQ